MSYRTCNNCRHQHESNKRGTHCGQCVAGRDFADPEGPDGWEQAHDTPVLAEETQDPTNPQHYRDFPVEVIQLVRHLNFNRGNAVKYLCRAGKKDDELQDLSKALWYVQDEIQRLTGEGDHAKP